MERAERQVPYRKRQHGDDEKDRQGRKLGAELQGQDVQADVLKAAIAPTRPKSFRPLATHGKGYPGQISFPYWAQYNRVVCLSMRTAEDT
jgi:hypothetical protein